MAQVTRPVWPSGRSRGEAVQRRLQLLVQGEPQPEPGEVIQAGREPAEGQRQGHEEGDRDARDQAHGASSTAGDGRVAEQVAPAPDRLDQPRAPRLQGPAQLLDVDVQGVGDEVVVLAPDVPVDPRPRQDLVGMAEEEDEQGQLLGRQVQGMARPLGLLRSARSTRTSR